MDKIDRRVKRTNRLLQEALIALTLEKGYEGVTIREITERADIGYATFFRHYPDKDALLTNLLETMVDDFMELMEPALIVTDPVKTGTLIFEYVLANQDLCRVLLNSTETMAVLKPLQQIGQQETLFLTTARDDEREGAATWPRIPADLAVAHLMTSLVMLVRWWLDHGTPYSPERMGEISAQLIIRPALDALQPKSR